MLVLSRKLGQSITIGDNITVTVLAINQSQVRIGIEAPRDVSVIRDDAINKTKKEG